MEKKTIIDKVKLLFSEIENKDEVKMIYYTTKEGLEVKIPEGSELVEGTPLFVVSEDGTDVPAPAGDYAIEDKIFTVDENGIIVSIAEVEVEVEIAPEPAEEEMSTEEVEATEEEVKEVETLEEVKIEDLVKRIDELETLMSEMKDKLSSVSTLEEKFSKLSKEPAEKEVKLSKASLVTTNNKNRSLFHLKWR